MLASRFAWMRFATPRSRICQSDIGQGAGRIRLRRPPSIKRGPALFHFYRGSFGIRHRGPAARSAGQHFGICRVVEGVTSSDLMLNLRYSAF